MDADGHLPIILSGGGANGTELVIPDSRTREYRIATLAVYCQDNFSHLVVLRYVRTGITRDGKAIFEFDGIENALKTG